MYAQLSSLSIHLLICTVSSIPKIVSQCIVGSVLTECQLRAGVAAGQPSVASWLIYVASPTVAQLMEFLICLHSDVAAWVTVVLLK